MNSRKAFSMIEILVVVILAGILAALGMSSYRTAMEKGRVSEAKSGLMEMRSIRSNYYLEKNVSGTVSWNTLRSWAEDQDDGHTLDKLPTSCSQDDSYYAYSINDTHVLAERCTHGGKPPAGPKYTISLNLENGTWSGTKGYY